MRKHLQTNAQISLKSNETLSSLNTSHAIRTVGSPSLENEDLWSAGAVSPRKPGAGSLRLTSSRASWGLTSSSLQRVLSHRPLQTLLAPPSSVATEEDQGSEGDLASFCPGRLKSVECCWLSRESPVLPVVNSESSEGHTSGLRSRPCWLLYSQLSVLSSVKFRVMVEFCCTRHTDKVKLAQWTRPWPCTWGSAALMKVMGIP